MLEDKIEELIGALEANTEALYAGGDRQTADNNNADTIGRIGEAEAAMNDDPKPVSKKKGSKKKASKKKAIRREPSVTIEQVKAELVKIDKESAKVVLKAFNVTKLTELPSENYEDAIEEAKAYMVDDSSDSFLD